MESTEFYEIEISLVQFYFSIMYRDPLLFNCCQLLKSLELKRLGKKCTIFTTLLFKNERREKRS